MVFDVNLVIYLLGLAALAGLTIGRLNALEKKVDKHNQVIERTYELEQKYAVLDNRQRVSEHRLEDLEKGESA